MTIPAAYARYSIPDLPGYGPGAIRSHWGVTLPPGGRLAAYVNSAGRTAYDDPSYTGHIFLTLAEALQYARSGYADTIVITPGHSENVEDATMLDNLKAGVKIIGQGHGALMPTFRWTETTSQWTIDQANVLISGLRLRMEGANGVVKAVIVTAADCCIEGCDIEVASGASNKATIMCDVSTGGARFAFVGNRVRGTATHNMTNGLLISAVVDGTTVIGNRMIASATAANGLVNVSVAATHVDIGGNIILNEHTASTASINVGDAASTGVIYNNMLGTINDGTVTAQGLVLGASSLVRCFQNFSCDEPIKSGVLTPGAAT